MAIGSGRIGYDGWEKELEIERRFGAEEDEMVDFRLRRVRLKRAPIAPTAPPLVGGCPFPVGVGGDAVGTDENPPLAVGLGPPRRTSTTSLARVLISSRTWGGLKWPNSSSVLLPFLYEHSRNIWLKVGLALLPSIRFEPSAVFVRTAILVAASTQTVLFLGMVEIESGSTSPKNRSSCPVLSFRMKNAVES